jgi:hypothetical protein
MFFFTFGQSLCIFSLYFAFICEGFGNSLSAYDLKLICLRTFRLQFVHCKNEEEEKKTWMIRVEHDVEAECKRHNEERVPEEEPKEGGHDGEEHGDVGGEAGVLAHQDQELGPGEHDHDGGQVAPPLPVQLTALIQHQ